MSPFAAMKPVSLFSLVEGATFLPSHVVPDHPLRVEVTEILLD